MNIPEIITKKRDGHELTPAEIAYIINGYSSAPTTASTPPTAETPTPAPTPTTDYQMAAFLMAVFFRGMTPPELTAYTAALVNSGKTLTWENIPGTVVDKHSSGGVGDKTTLIVAPIAAAAGLYMPKMSGRGLGFTGGTIDKLNSIPGFNTALTTKQLAAQTARIGLAIVGQTEELTPADGKIYALRDVTATVDSIPLIAASIMSKKIAGGAACIVLDVKAGSGAFMKTEEEARHLADTMVSIGENMGRRVKAVVSPMDEPLGNKVGNALEVEEAIKTLIGEGPRDLTELSLNLAANLIYLAENEKTAKPAAQSTTEEAIKTAYQKAEHLLKSGKAYEKFLQMVKQQEGDPNYIEKIANAKIAQADPTTGTPPAQATPAPATTPAQTPTTATTNPPENNACNIATLTTVKAAHTATINSSKSGTLVMLDALQIGKAAALLGAGRLKKEDTIDHAAGIIIHTKKGHPVKQGSPILTLLTNQQNTLKEAIIEAQKSITIT